jgi:hypothetical protein
MMTQSKKIIERCKRWNGEVPWYQRFFADQR